MNDFKNFSRRGFIKVTSIALAMSLGVTSVFGYSGQYLSGSKREESLLGFCGNEYQSSDGVAGLLFSQIGYEIGYPVRIIVRLPKKELLSDKAICKLFPESDGKKQETFCSYWGEIWGSHWWVAEFPGMMKVGEWTVHIIDKDKSVFHDKGLRVAKNVIWDATVELASVDMLERRALFTKVGAGWQDAGTLLVESCAQSAMIIGLEDLIDKGNKRLDKKLTERIFIQITVGCDYLVITLKKAIELGFPLGAMSHDLLVHEKDILSQDAMKAVIALLRAASLLPENYNDKKEKYKETANLAWIWLTTIAKPMGSYGMSLFQRGLPENTKIPNDEWQTRDLVLLCWGAFLKYKSIDEKAKEQCINYACSIMERQISTEQNEIGYYGHFREFSSLQHSEKSWTHGIVNKEFGADIGGIYPNYLMPFIDMLNEWPEHVDSNKWKSTLENFAKGFLISVCNKNPFQLVTQGVFGKEGPVWFCGTFHGTNTIYGYTAALAFELAKLLNEPQLKIIAYSNLQWLAGLNAEITKENLTACVIFSTDIPEGTALPASMKCGVGKRWVGSWFATRGVICNGFSTGKQFFYDTPPIKINDGPFSLLMKIGYPIVQPG